MDPRILPHTLKRWAILVGVGYSEGGMYNDTTGGFEVARVREWLVNGPLRVAPGNIQCLTSTRPRHRSAPAQTQWPRNSGAAGTRQPDWPVEEPAVWPTQANITKALRDRLKIAADAKKKIELRIRQRGISTDDEDRFRDLVFFYFMGHGEQGGGVVDTFSETIPATVMTDIFAEMGDVGLDLTVVMNCCFSGGLQRSQTEMTLNYPVMGGLPRYNLLVACSPYQTAGAGGASAYPGFDTPGSGGNFTAYILNSLNDNPLCTLKMIQRRAFASNTKTEVRELPMLREKNYDNCSFFGMFKNKVLPSIAAKWIDATTVELEGGEAHGIRQDSVYAVYRWDAKDIEAVQFNVRVTEVSPLTSKAVVNQAVITPAWKVVRIHPAMAIVSSAVLPPIDAKWVNGTTVELAAGGDDGVAVGSVYADSQWTIQNIHAVQAKVRVTEVFPGRARAVLEPAYITPACQVILINPVAVVAIGNMEARWAEYNRVLNLRNDAVDPSPSYLPDIFSFGVIDGTGEDEKLYDVYNAIKGRHYKLRFTMHDHPEYWYARLTVLQFTADGNIHKYYPRFTEYEVIEAGQDCEFEISRHMHGASKVRSTATFKAFITLAPTSFDTVLGSRIRGVPIRDRTLTRDNEHGVNREVTVPVEIDEDEWGTFRDAAPTGNGSNLPPRWRTMSVTIHTTPE
ncbi:hypothetical protein Q9L58_005835 [Maublancomyces gigas]|uniref:Uncharacterized protein n=1 Tax=Discina gigas TaxID=1032678 RepID=A0ABR3GGV9_9PEZI